MMKPAVSELNLTPTSIAFPSGLVVLVGAAVLDQILYVALCALAI